MNRTGLINDVVNESGLTTRAAEAVLDSMIYTITSVVRNGEVVRIAGFGTFKPRYLQARHGQDTQSGSLSPDQSVEGHRILIRRDAEGEPELSRFNRSADVPERVGLCERRQSLSCAQGPAGKESICN